MGNNANGNWGRLRGVQHPPEADIQNIRSLLVGYGSESSVLKELIQNAEDAEARHLDLILTPGNPNATHPLLRTNSLCVVNDGDFQPKHLQAIFRLGLGTKGSDPRAIGRFGKGLKSVFALCEAFFVVAQTDRSKGWERSEVCEFFNPWHGWRHKDWDEAFDAGMEDALTHISRCVSMFQAECAHWLAFWLPLRHPSQQQDEQGVVAWIHESTGGTLPGKNAHLGTALAVEFMRLAPSLVTLRNLQRIRLIEETSATRQETIWSRSEESVCVPDPDSARPPERVQGAMLVQNPTGQTDTLHYVGFAGTLPERLVAHTKENNDWPKIVDITESASSADQKAKGVPHFATILTAKPEPKGTLEVRWSVFFPVGEQPQGIREVSLTRLAQAITLSLHGFFFLDTDRRHVDGLQKHFENAHHPCLEWNKIVAKEGTLAYLPKAVASFATEHGLDDEQCRDLADALRKTWIWEHFQTAICRNESWRPRWRSGVVIWECLSVETPVLLIPPVSNPAETMSCLPQLGPISEHLVLAVRRPDGAFSGLHENNAESWPERSVIELLKNVQLRPAKDESTARWINDFLDELKQNNNLTSRIAEVVSALPLQAVRDARTNAMRRVGAQEWESLCQSDQLFALPGAGTNWLRLLCEAFPHQSFAVSGHYPPRWYSGNRAPNCDERVAARVVLRQPELGSFSSRAKLWDAFAMLPFPSPFITHAMRYLMHADHSHAHEATTSLWISAVAPGQQIWARLFHHLHKDDSGTKPWQLLDTEWKNKISPSVQQKLNILTVDAEGAWKELLQNQGALSTLDFSSDEWADNDIATLLQGLHQAGKSKLPETLTLLRQLRVHPLASNPEQRVSVADHRGQLDEQFVLQTQDFDTQIPMDLKPLWLAFLAETKIIARLQTDIPVGHVQEQLFQRVDEEENAYTVALNWDYVVRRCLEASDLSGRARLILQAFAIKGNVTRDITEKLKSTRWLPLELGDYIAPDSVVHIAGLEDDLHRLLDPVKDGLAGTRALPEWVSNHNGFGTLRSYFRRTNEALELLGMWLADKPDWHLGLTKSFQPTELEPLLAQLKDFENLPIASLLVKLRGLSDEKLASWLQEYILPSVLQKFDYTQDGLAKIENILCRLQSLKSRDAFDAYLNQACIDGVIKETLPKLSLVNQCNKWIPAGQLIWPSENLDPAAQLCVGQAEILDALRKESAYNESHPVGNQQGLTQTRGNQLIEPPDFAAQADKLKEYLRPFENGNVGVNLPAALVAVLSSHPRIKEHLQHLLQTGLGQTPEIFVARLFGERGGHFTNNIDSVRFLIDVVRTQSIETKTLTDETITVSLTDEINTLIVGDIQDLWFNYFYKNQSCRILRLRWIERPDELSDLVGVFASTIETIILKVYCNGVAACCPDNLKDVLAGIADAGQVALRRSQYYLLDMAEARLKELGVKGVPQFQAVLQKFDEARQARVDAMDLDIQAPIKAQQQTKLAEELVKTAVNDLLKLLTEQEEAETRHTLVMAVRRKMTDFQYSLASVVQELFQNADDAVAEWNEMRGTLDPLEHRFALRLDTEQRVLEIIHWGRPINQHEYPGFKEGRNRGYDQDLVKMLTLNFSDKGIEKESRQSIVTGLFGLGFKSVFFVSEQPQVISGRLAFEIRGGFYPEALSPEVAREMREKASELGGNSLAPTVIRLNWNNEDYIVNELVQAVVSFTRIAPLLTIFSRHLQTLIVSDDIDNKTWTNVEHPLTEAKQITHVRIGNQAYLCFRCPLSSDQRPATVLFKLDPNGISQLEDELTGLWITTPTAERSELRWALNAPFKPDAGRQRLALNNPENKAIAEEVARAWGKALIELFGEAEKNWCAMATKLGLHANVSVMKCWQQLWQETTGSAPILQWNEILNGGQVLQWIAWGESIGAMRGLIEQRRAIPSGLPGTYEKMLSQSEVKYAITGILAEITNGCFEQVEKWDAIRTAFPPGQTVSRKTEAQLRRMIPDLQLKQITLQKVFAAESGPQNHVGTESAERIGTLLEKCEAIFETNSHAWHEDGLRDWMTQRTFLAQDGSYHSASELVCSRAQTDLIEKDEALRAAFAPESTILFTGYSESAICFFVKARLKLAANAVILAEWAQQASVNEKLPAVFIYLAEGELGQALADKLGQAWLEEKRANEVFRNLSEAQRSEIERKFFKGMSWYARPYPFSVPLLIERPVEQVMEAKEAFRCVWQWWAKEGNDRVAEYENKTYSTGFPRDLPWPGEDTWDEASSPSPHSRWLLLFVHAALVPLGLNSIGRDQGFLQFLNSRNLLGAFGKSSTEPHVVLEAIDQYLDSFIQNTRFHFQMRQFVAFYAVARNLEDFLESLRAAELYQGAGSAFQYVFSPKANPALTATGITAPPIAGMLGMGSCQLLRELYRLGRLSNSSGFPYAFTPLKKVRRLCKQLFDTSYESHGAQSSPLIFNELQRLGSVLDLDPTFNRCFDLPFQFLAEDEKLCKKVLGPSWSDGTYAMPDFDPLSDLEDFYGEDDPS